jgi:hypothetical protein
LLALGILALIVFMWLRDLHKLYLLLTGKVPMHKIVRFVLIMLVGLAILFPLMLHWERNSPLHLVIKPQAESRVRASAESRELIGDGLTFCSEWNFSTHEEGQNGAGDFSFAVRGSKGKGEVEVTALEKDATWSLDSVTLVVKDRRVPIPAN